MEPAEMKQVLAGMLPEYAPCFEEPQVAQLLEGAELSALDELYAGGEPAPLRMAGPYRTT